MNLRFRVDIGPFVVEAGLNETGVFLRRGPMEQTVRWDQIYGGGLLRSARPSQTDAHEKELDQWAAQFLGGPDAVAKIRALQDEFQVIALAYRDERGHRQLLEFPAPVEDPRYVQEITSRLGSSWHESFSDRHEAEHKLGTAPGFFKLAFVLILFLIALPLLGLLALFSMLGPAFNFLSLQRMLLDLQDGEYASFATRLLTYVVLFSLAVLIRRWLRARMAARRARISHPLMHP
jgi:hypothetical protein